MYRRVGVNELRGIWWYPGIYPKIVVAVVVIHFILQVLSIEFGKQKDISERIKHELVRKVQEHPHDFYSLPVGIANLTVKIRNDQAALEKLNQR